MIRATTPRERAALAAIHANGLHVEPIGTAGAVRVFGHGVYVLLAWIGSVHPIDLQPVHEFHRGGASDERNRKP